MPESTNAPAATPPPDPAAIRTAERARISGIDAVLAMMGTRTAPMDELRTRAVSEGWDSARFAVELRGLAPAHSGGPVSAPGGSFQAGPDALEKFRDGATDALMVRAGLTTEAEAVRKVREGGLAGYDLMELGREYARVAGLEIRSGNRLEFAGSVLSRAAGPATHSDFPSILANVANKAMLMGWSQFPATWRGWCSVGSLPDFKQATIAGLSGFTDLDQIPRAGGPYQFGNMEDQHETAQMVTYGKLFGLSREALVNDDLNAFTRTPMKMTLAAARKVNSLAYAVLTSNQTMTYDSTALFHADHSNLVAPGSGAGPSVSTLDAAFQAMAKQTAPVKADDGSTIYLGITPGVLLVPVALDYTSRVLVSADVNPAEGTTTAFVEPNGFKGRLQVVSDPLLDADDPLQWYLAARPGSAVDTVTMFFLDGQQDPWLEEVPRGEYDGITWKVRIDAVARALDHRGLYQNDGN